MTQNKIVCKKKLAHFWWPFKWKLMNALFILSSCRNAAEGCIVLLLFLFNTHSFNFHGKPSWLAQFLEKYGYHCNWSSKWLVKNWDQMNMVVANNKKGVRKNKQHIYEEWLVLVKRLMQYFAIESKYKQEKWLRMVAQFLLEKQFWFL